VGAVLITLRITGGLDALVLVLSGVIGLVGSLVMPTIRTVRGMRKAREDAYADQLKPLIDEYDDRLKGKDREIEALQRRGRPAVPALVPLDATVAKDVRHRLEQIVAPFQLVVDRAVNVLEHHRGELYGGQHARGVVAGMLREPAERLRASFDEFRSTLGAQQDARGPFLHAFAWYRDVRRLGQVLKEHYPVSMSEMLHGSWQRDDAAFDAACGVAFAIGELADVREHLASYRPREIL